MKIEFTKEEIERIILAHANALVKHYNGVTFNKVETSYSYIPSTIAVVHEEPKQEELL